MTKLWYLAHISNYSVININLAATNSQVNDVITMSLNSLFYLSLSLVFVFSVERKQISFAKKKIWDAGVNYNGGDKISKVRLN